MLTDVDAKGLTVDRGLWLTISDLARSRGISKQGVSKRVDRFVSQKLLTLRPGPRGSKLINVAEFDRAAGAATDVVRAFNGGGSLDFTGAAAAPTKDTADPSSSEQLTRENARKAAYNADLAKLDLDERLGKLLPVEDVLAATVTLGEKIVRQFDQLPTHAEDLAAAVAKDGAPGARAFLKSLAFNFRSTLAGELSLLASPKSASADADDATTGADD